MKKFRLVLDLIDAGAVTPDPLELAYFGNVAKECGDLGLARRAERIVRRLAPNWQKDLS